MSSSEPVVSNHAGKRWDQRTPPDSVSPETAWEHSQRVNGPERLTGTDEARVHLPTQTVLLRSQDCIVTVLSERECSRDVYNYVEPVINQTTESEVSP